MANHDYINRQLKLGHAGPTKANQNRCYEAASYTLHTYDDDCVTYRTHLRKRGKYAVYREGTGRNIVLLRGYLG